MIQIRTQVFETNSSMTHSIVMCKDEEFEKFQKGEYFFNEYMDPRFLPKEEALKKNAEKLREYLADAKTDDPQYCFEDETIEALTEENIKLYEEGKFDLCEFCLDKWETSEELYFDWEYYWETICEYYETFDDSYNGVTAFGYYGHD